MPQADKDGSNPIGSLNMDQTPLKAAPSFYGIFRIIFNDAFSFISYTIGLAFSNLVIIQYAV
jgi:hypothetical protein